MPALLGGIATDKHLHQMKTLKLNRSIYLTLEMPAFLGGIATVDLNGLKFRMKEKLLK